MAMRAPRVSARNEIDDELAAFVFGRIRNEQRCRKVTADHRSAAQDRCVEMIAVGRARGVAVEHWRAHPRHEREIEESRMTPERLHRDLRCRLSFGAIERYLVILLDRRSDIARGLAAVVPTRAGSDVAELLQLLRVQDLFQVVDHCEANRAPVLRIRRRRLARFVDADTMQPPPRRGGATRSSRRLPPQA